MSNKIYLYLLSLGHFCTDFSVGAFPAVLPFFVLHQGLSYTDVAVLMFASSCLSSVVQPLFGLMADRYRCHWLMGAGIAFSGVSLGVTGFTSNFWMIFACVTLMGFGSAIFHPEAARLTNVIAGEKKGQAMAMFSTGGIIGFGAGPLLAVALLDPLGLKGTFAFALLGALAGGGFLMMVPAFSRMVDTFAQKTVDKAKAARKAVSEASNDWWAFSRLTVVIIGRSILQCSLSAFLPLFCIAKLGVSESVGGTTLSFLSFISVVMTLAGGWLADRFGLVKALRICYLLLVPSFLALVYAPNIWTVYAVLVPLSFATVGPYASFVVLGQTYLAKNIGFASGITMGLSFSIGGMVVPFLGMLADAQGVVSVMWVLTVVAAFCTLSTFLLPEPKREST